MLSPIRFEAQAHWRTPMKNYEALFETIREEFVKMHPKIQFRDEKSSIIARRTNAVHSHSDISPHTNAVCRWLEIEEMT